VAFDPGGNPCLHITRIDLATGPQRSLHHCAKDPIEGGFDLRPLEDPERAGDGLDGRQPSVVCLGA
jgi:hypothetical protein